LDQHARHDKAPLRIVTLRLARFHAENHATALEARDFRDRFSVQARECFHEQVHRTIEVSSVDDTRVGVQIAGGDGEIDRWLASTKALHLCRVFRAACGDFGLQRDVVLGGHAFDEIAQLEVDQHRSISEVDYRPRPQAFLRPVRSTTRMVSRDASFQRDSKIRLYGFDRRMRPAQAHFFLDGAHEVEGIGSSNATLLEPPQGLE